MEIFIKKLVIIILFINLIYKNSTRIAVNNYTWLNISKKYIINFYSYCYFISKVAPVLVLNVKIHLLLVFHVFLIMN